MVGRAPHDRDELVVAERLLYVVERALIHRLNRGLQRCLGRHQDDRDVRILLAGRCENIETSHAGHPDIQR